MKAFLSWEMKECVFLQENHSMKQMRTRWNERVRICFLGSIKSFYVTDEH